MKRIPMLLGILLMMNSTVLESKIGCLANSTHLKTRGDTKSYHLVRCLCDCDHYHAKGAYCRAQNKCYGCGHSHDPMPLIIVTNLSQTKQTKNPGAIECEKKALQRLIERFGPSARSSVFDK